MHTHHENEMKRTRKHYSIPTRKTTLKINPITGIGEDVDKSDSCAAGASVTWAGRCRQCKMWAGQGQPLWTTVWPQDPAIPLLVYIQGKWKHTLKHTQGRSVHSVRSTVIPNSHKMETAQTSNGCRNKQRVVHTWVCVCVCVYATRL